MAAPAITLDDCRAGLSAASLEWLVCDPEAFALTTPTPVQRAIFRAVEGRPLGKLADNPHVLEAFGGRLPTPGVRPREVVLLGGVRAAKSLCAAASGVRWSQTVDLRNTRATDMPRINVASLDKDKAHVILDDHLRGTLKSGRLISALYVDDGNESVILRHPTGRAVEAKVVAGKRAGASLVARWSAGTVFDEAPRMVGDDEGVINLDDMRAAVLGRLLPEAQCFYIGSPHAPFGPVYDLHSRHFGNPSHEVLVIEGQGPLMNPTHWTPERCEELRKADPDAYRTDVLCKFLTPEEALFPHLALEACKRPELELSPSDRVQYCAAMDPATRGNAWTLCIAGLVNGKRSIVLAREWRGSTASPLSPSVVLHEIAALCHRYRVTSVRSDQHSFDALRDLASMSGLNLALCTWTETERAQAYLRARAMIVEGEASLPPDPVLHTDLRRVKRKAVASGIRVVLPDTGDGRHCDYAPSAVMALGHVPQEAPPVPVEDPEVLRMRKLDQKRYGQRRGG